MERHPRRRLRSTAVPLGALTALALTLSGCNMIDDDDDDCALGPTSNDNLVVAGMRAPTVSPARPAAAPDQKNTAAVPESGGFGTHLASCGG